MCNQIFLGTDISIKSRAFGEAFLYVSSKKDFHEKFENWVYSAVVTLRKDS